MLVGMINLVSSDTTDCINVSLLVKLKENCLLVSVGRSVLL